MLPKTEDVKRCVQWKKNKTQQHIHKHLKRIQIENGFEWLRVRYTNILKMNEWWKLKKKKKRKECLAFGVLAAFACKREEWFHYYYSFRPCKMTWDHSTIWNSKFEINNNSFHMQNVCVQCAVCIDRLEFRENLYEKVCPMLKLNFNPKNSFIMPKPISIIISYFLIRAEVDMFCLYLIIFHGVFFPSFFSSLRLQPLLPLPVLFFND